MDPEPAFWHTALVSTVKIGRAFIERPWHRIGTQTEVELVARRLAGVARVAVDTETTGLEPGTSAVRLLQLATPDEAFIIDGTLDLSPLGALLTDGRTLKVMHNAAFDVPMLQLSAGLPVGVERVVCTLTLERLLSEGGDPTTSNALAAAVSRRLHYVLDKGPRKDIATVPELTDMHWEYAARDAIVLLPLLAHQERELRARGLVGEAVARTRLMREEIARAVANPQDLPAAAGADGRGALHQEHGPRSARRESADQGRTSSAG